MLEKAAIPQFLDVLDEAEKIAKICQPKGSITEADIKQSIEEGQKAIEKKIRKAAKRGGAPRSFQFFSCAAVRKSK